MLLSLRGRVLLAAACAVAMFGLLLFATTRHAAEERERNAEARAVALSRMLAQAPAALPDAPAAAVLDRLLPLAGGCDPDLLFAVFTDAKGAEQARWSRPANEGGPDPRDLPALADPQYRGQPGWKLVDVTLQNRTGEAEQHLRVGYSLAAARQGARRDLLGVVLWFALVSALILAAAWFAALRMARSLETIAGGLPALERGQAIATPLAGGPEVAAIARAANALAAGMRSRVRLQDNFARFVSEPVARKVIADDRTVRLGGERRVVTVLFADIRGFTAYASTQPPERVVTVLNQYFESLTDVIPRYGGTLDKFMGDALMAVFNAATDLEHHEISAVMAGLEMVRVMAEINQRRRAANQQELRLGIGINTGEVVAGTFGSQNRLEYTVIGAAVNLAQRIQGQARNGEMLLAERTYQAVRHLIHSVALDPIELRGIRDPVRLYRVQQLRSGAHDATAKE